jgi:hypothetical protein
MTMRRLQMFLVGALALSVGGGALAFGTIDGMGQNREHERITRHALGCGQGGVDASACFEKASLDELAGKPKTWGAVGAPDNPARGLMLSSEAHCDNGDWVDVAGYPQSRQQARDALVRCRAGMNAHLDEAVRDAARLLDSRGRIDDSQIPTWVSCTYLAKKGRAKCDVLEDLGQTLHASQDFYSHSNWVDQAASGAVTLSNPAGLGHGAPAPWLDLRRDIAFPDGLITGCFDTLSLASPAKGCSGHVKHEDLNKDKGTIDPSIGVGTTGRGKVGSNFRLAVEAAIGDTRDKWATLRERLNATYGPTKARLMTCALTHDNPAKTCS